MGKSQKATPKTRQVSISTQALQNINEVTGYIAFVAQSPTNAIKVGDAIFATIDRFERNPLAFKACEELPTKAKMYRRALCFIPELLSTKSLILKLSFLALFIVLAGRQ